MLIEEYLYLSVADCKRLGYLKPNDAKAGGIDFTRHGRVVASIGFATDTRGVPVARFAYNYNGRNVDATIPLRWKRSNLRPDTPHGYYYFVCPDTGALCRKLYLVNGQFVSRRAFRALYMRQTQSHKQAENATYWRAVGELDYILANDERHRLYYRGRLTRYGRRLRKLETLAGYAEGLT